MRDDVDNIRKRKSNRNTGMYNKNKNNEVTDDDINNDSSANNKVDRLSANENMNNEEIINKVSGNYSNEYNSEIIREYLDLATFY